MKLTLASISTAKDRGRRSPAEELAAEYIQRAGRYMECAALVLPSEAALLAWLDTQARRTAPVFFLLDRCGKMLASEEFAQRLGRLRDSGAQTVVLAIGPADGWTEAARARADLIVSFGPITLPHELARVVLAEQVYRALTILAGHPYHSGH